MEPEPILEEIKLCPYCREPIRVVAKKCRHCGRYLEPGIGDDDHGPDAVERMLLPVGRPASAIAAGYLGLFALIPCFGPIALIVSIFALRNLKRHPEMSGRGRAIFGLVMGILSTLVVVLAIVGMVVDASKGAHGR